jgi:hypothetical protein
MGMLLQSMFVGCDRSMCCMCMYGVPVPEALKQQMR